VTVRLMNQGGRGEIGFVEVPDDFDFPERMKVSYPNLRLIWGEYRLESRARATYRWIGNCAPPEKP
jgi:hypothetical protein